MTDSTGPAAESEVVTRTGPGALRPYEKFVKSLQMQAETGNTERGFEVSAQMMDRVLTAGTEAEMWDADEGGLLAGRDLDDVWQQIKGYTVVKSTREDIEGGFGVYAVIDAVNLHTGEAFTWETGATGILSKLAWLRANDKFPVRCMVKAVNVGGGRAVLKLRPLPVIAAPTTA